MDQPISYIALAIPIFFLLIGVELLVSKLKKTNLYRFNDAVTNLSCGIGQQVVGVFGKTVIFLGYYFLYENFRLLDIQSHLLTWILLFIGIDFFYYWFHRLAHEVSFMWGSHVVHHQSEEYNLSVALRQGWVQSFFSSIFYLPLAFIGFHPLLFIVINQFQTLYQFWIHTRTINKLPAAFEYVFNTPSHHRVHHGVNPKYIDKNHGGTLIIFDRIFGTFQAEEEEVVYGVTVQPKSWNPLWLNVEYWVDMVQTVRQASNWRDKMGILLKEPGWKPAELGGPIQGGEVTPETFHKYDTSIPNGLNYYILVHYLILLLSATGFLFMSGQLDWSSKLLTAVLIIFALINLGGLFEKKWWVFLTENTRLLAFAAMFVVFLNGYIGTPMAIVIAAIYLMTSALWLNIYRNIFNVG